MSDIKNALLTYLLFAVIFAALFFSGILLSSYREFENFFVSVNKIPFSHISKSEYDMMIWLDTNVNVKSHHNAYVISDYATAFMLRGLTDLNTTADRNVGMSVNDWHKMQTNTLWLFNHNVDKKTYTIINTIKSQTHSDEIYLVISLRTCWWVDMNKTDAIRFLPLPSGYTFDNYCSNINKKFDYNLRFVEIYHNNETRVYSYRSSY